MYLYSVVRPSVNWKLGFNFKIIFLLQKGGNIVTVLTDVHLVFRFPNTLFFLSYLFWQKEFAYPQHESQIKDIKKKISYISFVQKNELLSYIGQ